MKITAPEEFGFSPDRLKRIDAVMQRYVDQRTLAGIVTLVARRSGIAHFEKFGFQDIETRKPMELDTIFRIYSMTKPITSVALMMLFEHGLVRLTDPVTKFIPEFKKVKVFVSEGELADLEREITIQDLLRHTAGLSYGDEDSPVDELYRQADIFNPDITLAEMIRLVLDKGELDGVRLLGPKTMELMTTNHLPSALMPIAMGEEQMPGFGFGLGFSVMMDVVQSGMMGSVGLHGWGGWANTHFWVDPQEQLIGILMLQYVPSSTYPVTNDFRTLVYQALID